MIELRKITHDNFVTSQRDELHLYATCRHYVRWTVSFYLKLWEKGLKRNAKITREKRCETWNITSRIRVETEKRKKQVKRRYL